MNYSIQQVDFDYSVLKEDTRTLVESCTGEIRSQLQKSAEGMIEAGRRLSEVKAALKHGQFGGWLRAEFAMTDRMARNLMNVYSKSETVSDLGKNMDKFAPSALYLLAEKSTSRQVIEKAVQRATKGEHVTRQEVQAMKRAYAFAEKTSVTRAVPKPPLMSKKAGTRDDLRGKLKALIDGLSERRVQALYEQLCEEVGR